MQNAHAQRSTSTQCVDQPSQWATLGVLRFFLAFIVVLGHYVRFVGPDSYHLFDATDASARSAVWGFFVLSGFSIAASLNRETTGYFGRRILRIYPIYIAAICAGLALYAFGIVPTTFDFPLGGEFHVPPARMVIASLLMLQTVFGTVQIIWPTWSLSIEWWHYMIAPGLRKLPNYVLIIAAGLSWGLYLKLTSGPVSPAIDSIQFGWRALACSWLWLGGFIFFRIKDRRLRITLLVLPIVVTILAHRFTGMPLLVTLVILLVSSEIRLSRDIIVIFEWLGDLSYPIYLFHGMILVTACSIGRHGELSVVAAILAVSIAALYLVDYPCRKLFKQRVKLIRMA
jgi:peptidoglycan/LPS O-acetylase OafA/YrhL